MTLNDDDLDSRTTELTAELRRLSRGNGVEAADILTRIGPRLRSVCGITADMGPERARRLLVDRLLELTQVLNPDHRLVVLAAFALREDLRAPTCKERIARVLPQIARDERTIFRWLDAACERMAQAAVEPPATPPTPWHTTSLDVTVALHLPTPEIYERRIIVADQDDLREVELSLTWALVDGRFHETDIEGLDVDVLYGGSIKERILQAERRVSFVLKLPRPLGRNKEHEYMFRVKLAQNYPIEPFYVCTPRYPCQSFRLHVRFENNRVPNSIWKIHRTSPTEIVDSVTRRETVPVDCCGEVHAEFLDLATNMSYGLRWSHDVTAAGAGGGPAPN